MKRDKISYLVNFALRCEQSPWVHFVVRGVVTFEVA